MNVVFLHRATGLALAAGLAAGCATAPHRYLYQPPGWVGARDRQACHLVAERVAQQRYERYTETIELAGQFGGAFGGISLAQRAWEEREEFYEAEMKACLRERGYSL